MNIQTIFGIIALVTSFIGLLPQSYKAFKTKSTRDVSMLMLLNFLLCSLAWIVYGFKIHAGFVIASNIIGFATSLLLIMQKSWYDQRTEQYAQR